MYISNLHFTMQKSNLLKTLYKTVLYHHVTSQNYRSLSKTNINYSSIQLIFKRCTQTNNMKCWRCGTERKLKADILCENCNVIQHPSCTDNYYKILDIEESFNLDQKSLTTKYRKLQAILHPDKFSNKSAEEKLISADYSALVNKAYNTLQSPLNRAIHMLNLHGQNIEEDQKVSDPEFLMEIMELNEEVEQAKNPDELRTLNERNKQMLKNIGKEISENFQINDVDKARDNIIKMKYYNSIKLYINGLLRERGIVD